MSGTILSCQGLYKSFGNFPVTDNVSFDVADCEIHALIGPNGAGKTTLLSQICGDIFPDSGRLLLQGHDITRLAPHRRMRLGLSRSFQVVSLFEGLTVLENAMLAVQSRCRRISPFLKPAAHDKRLIEKSEQLLSIFSLHTVSGRQVCALSYGERRRLDIALALASEPKILLLDEPMAGIGDSEAEGLVFLFKELRIERTLLLVEHDMDVVFSLADRISVLIDGKLVVTGSPDEVHAHEVAERMSLFGCRVSCA